MAIQVQASGSKFPARSHAQKLVEQLVKLLPEPDRTGTHAIFLQGHPTTCRDDTDRELPFHQEANFNYLTGAHDVASASVLVVATLGLGAQPAAVVHTLFVPPADPLETMWSVAPPTLEEAVTRFDADEFKSTSALGDILDTILATAPAPSSGHPMVSMHTLPVTTEYPPLPGVLSRLLPPAISNASPLSSPLAHSRRDSFRVFNHKTAYLLQALHIARLTKTEGEIELIRRANAITSGAHEVLMRELGRYAAARSKRADKDTKERTGYEGVNQWEVESEADAEALFVATCLRMGADQAYLPICASGSHASTLHYVCNDRLFPSTAVPRAPGDTSFVPRRLARGCCGDVPEHEHDIPTTSFHSAAFEPQVLLIDAGCEWQGYASDVTRTIPIGNGGKFTPLAGEIYELVLKMQKECEALVQVGVHWDTLHLHAHKVLIAGFLSLGIFKGDAETLLQSGLSCAFFPHGLGHSLGLDVHDSRQYLKATHLDLPETSQTTPASLYTYLRIRLPLAADMVLTVEPGCYFAPQLLDTHGVWESPLVDQEVLKRFLPVGGVRIEDVIVVTPGGSENLTTVGRDRAWVEARCSGL